MVGGFALKYHRLIFTFLFLFFFLSVRSYPEDLVYTDQMGRTISVPKNPDRIISLAPNITEILFALDAGGRVVGVTEFSNYPPEAQNLPKVGTYIKPNIERMVELLPDIVIATADGDKEGEVKKLDSLGIPVYVINPKDINGILETIREVGKLIGSTDEANELTTVMEEKIRDVRERVSKYPKVRVLLELGIDPVITISSGTFQDDLIGLAGGINIAAGERVRYPRFSIEEVIVRAPEVIIITSMTSVEDHGQGFKRWSRWETIPAVKDGRIYLIDSDIIDRPSPRIVCGLEALSRFFHPEAYRDEVDHGD
jgi:iron complex transport system substrate-binding protein